MPIDKYLVIRKAAEVEEIIHRITLISDMNAAFFGSTDRVKDLQKTYTQLMGYEEVIKWEADKDWEIKLSKYAR